MPKQRLNVNPRIGVAGDFINEVASFFTCTVGILEGNDLFSYEDIKAAFDEGKPHFYEERFPPDKYEDVVNERNAGVVDEINDLVVQIRDLKDIPKEKFPYQKLLDLCIQVRILVHGK